MDEAACIAAEAGHLITARTEDRHETRTAALPVRLLLGFLALGITLGLLIVVGVVVGRNIIGPWRPWAYGFDRAVAETVTGWKSMPLDYVLWSLTYIGEKWPMALGSASVFAFLLWRRRYAASLSIAFAMPGTAILWAAISYLVQRQRPNWWEPFHLPSDLGFPGGHVINAVVVALVCLSGALPVLQIRWQRWAVIGFWVFFVGGTMLSRIYVNAHFATDNLMGLAIGVTWALVSMRLARWMFPNCRNVG